MYDARVYQTLVNSSLCDIVKSVSCMAWFCSLPLIHIYELVSPHALCLCVYLWFLSKCAFHFFDDAYIYIYGYFVHMCISAVLPSDTKSPYAVLIDFAAACCFPPGQVFVELSSDTAKANYRYHEYIRLIFFVFISLLLYVLWPCLFFSPSNARVDILLTQNTWLFCNIYTI